METLIDHLSRLLQFLKEERAIVEIIIRTINRQINEENDPLLYTSGPDVVSSPSMRRAIEASVERLEMQRNHFYEQLNLVNNYICRIEEWIGFDTWYD